jgi:sorting nexin-25
VLQDTDVNTTLGLRDILTNPSSLSYFMEFMDRRGRSLLAQFWLTVETFKNPLESVDSDTSADETEIVADPNIFKTLQEDMILVNNLYFSGPVVSPALSAISRKHIEAVRSYAEQPTREIYHERKVRRSVMLAQREVEQDMENDFEDFRRSDFWFRVVADLAPKLDDHASPHTPISPKLHNTTSNPPGLLASLTRSLTPDLSRTNSNAIVNDTPVSAPVLNAGASSQSSKLSVTRNGSGAQAQDTLQFLVSPRIEREEGRAPLFNETDDGKLVSSDADEALRMEAIQAAVTDILASENLQSNTRGRTRQISEASHAAPSEESLPIYSQKRKAMFEDVEETADSLDEQRDDIDDSAEGAFEMPAPGDLQLSSEIARLTDKISHLQSQDVILDTLIRKAELTGDAQELRLLRRSKSALERELRQLTFQKTQYEQQESANKLVPGKTKATIVNATIAEEDGKAIVRYLIEVLQLGPNGENASGWVVARRYSEFFVMHQRLRERFVTVKNLDFPGKRLVTSLSSTMVDSRRVALEKYLQVSSQ